MNTVLPCQLQGFPIAGIKELRFSVFSVNVRRANRMNNVNRIQIKCFGNHGLAGIAVSVLFAGLFHHFLPRSSEYSAADAVVRLKPFVRRIYYTIRRDSGNINLFNFDFTVHGRIPPNRSVSPSFVFLLRILTLKSCKLLRNLLLLCTLLAFLRA